jgi:hypothetical protein
MPKLKVQIKGVKAGKSFADPKVTYTFVQEGYEVDPKAVEFFSKKSLEENNIIELEYDGE